MKEIEDIVQAYQLAKSSGNRVALATVVHVEGSSYRRPGARMLVTDEGQLTGAISGGCLEGDALRKALIAINEQRNKLVTYDTTDDDDATFGVQLGCNGIVHILFEPIIEEHEHHPLQLLGMVASKRQDAVLTTVFSLERGNTEQPGTRMLCTLNSTIACIKSSDVFDLALLEQDVEQALNLEKSSIRQYHHNSQKFTALIDHIKPPVALYIFGAGNDAVPVVNAAHLLGWHTTVIDGRASHATRARFPNAREVRVTKADSLKEFQGDQRSAYVLMSHNYNYDLAVLRLLTLNKCMYIGSLGPVKKLERMLEELGVSDNVREFSRSHNMFGPVGLDIGAETAEEIAISVIAEIKAVFENRAGNSLRDKREAIHTREL